MIRWALVNGALEWVIGAALREPVASRVRRSGECVDRAEGRRSLVTARVRTSVLLVALAAAVLMASGCGTAGRSAATGVADSVAATSHAAPGSHPAAATRAARTTPSRASSPLTPTGSVTGCQDSPDSYRVSPGLHGGRLLCSRSGSPSGRLGSVPLPG